MDFKGEILFEVSEFQESSISYDFFIDSYLSVLPNLIIFFNIGFFSYSYFIDNSSLSLIYSMLSPRGSSRSYMSFCKYLCMVTHTAFWRSCVQTVIARTTSILHKHVLYFHSSVRRLWELFTETNKPLWGSSVSQRIY